MINIKKWCLTCKHQNISETRLSCRPFLALKRFSFSCSASHSSFVSYDELHQIKAENLQVLDNWPWAVSLDCLCNYWDSTLFVIPVKGDGQIHGSHPARLQSQMREKDDCHGQKVGGWTIGIMTCQPSHRDREISTLVMQLFLIWFMGCVAYMLDLGKDLTREINYSNMAGMLRQEFSFLPSGWVLACLTGLET